MFDNVCWRWDVLADHMYKDGDDDDDDDDEEEEEEEKEKEEEVDNALMMIWCRGDDEDD